MGKTSEKGSPYGRESAADIDSKMKMKVQLQGGRVAKKQQQNSVNDNGRISQIAQ